MAGFKGLRPNNVDHFRSGGHIKNQSRRHCSSSNFSSALWSVRVVSNIDKVDIYGIEFQRPMSRLSQGWDYLCSSNVNTGKASNQGHCLSS